MKIKNDVLFIKNTTDLKPISTVNRDQNYPYWLLREKQMPPRATAFIGAILLVGVVSSLILFAKIPVTWGIGIFMIGIVIGLAMMSSSYIDKRKYNLIQKE